MFSKKDKPNLGDFRIAERFVATANTVVYDIQRYSLLLSWDSEWKEWNTLRSVGSLREATDWVNRYRKEADVKYHYCQ